jgi:hypothetical protein
MKKILSFIAFLLISKFSFSQEREYKPYQERQQRPITYDSSSNTVNEYTIMAGELMQEAAQHQLNSLLLTAFSGGALAIGAMIQINYVNLNNGIKPMVPFEVVYIVSGIFGIAALSQQIKGHKKIGKAGVYLSYSMSGIKITF